MYLLACDLCNKIIEDPKQLGEREISIFSANDHWSDEYIRHFHLCKDTCTKKFDNIISGLLSRKNSSVCQICGNKLNVNEVRVCDPNSYGIIGYYVICTKCRKSFNDKINSLFKKERKNHGQTGKADIN